MPKLTDLQNRLAELNRDFPRPRMPPLELSTLYDLQADWPKQWFGSDSSGVYVFLDEHDEVLYVGKASCGATIGSRLGAYFGYGADGKAKLYSEFYSGVRRVATIVMPEDREFEAPSVEEFLISRLGPSLNTLGKRADTIESQPFIP